jgi:NADH-quinone oxidoreductase subunit G
LGQPALARPDGYEILSLAAKVATGIGAVEDGWNGFNILHAAAARVAGLDLGFVPGKDGLGTTDMIAAAGRGGIEVLYLLGADEIDMSALGEAFVIYQGSHGDNGAHRADVILPGAAYTEKEGTYTNTEGRVQMTARAIFPPGEAREDWSILKAVSDAIGKSLPFSTLQELRGNMYASASQLAQLDTFENADPSSIATMAKHAAKPGSEPFGISIDDYYLTNPIARASAIMASLSAMGSDAERSTGTDG